MRFDVPFEVRDAVVLPAFPGTRQHLDVGELQTGLLVERHRRTAVQTPECLFEAALPPSAADDIERLLGRINAAYWEVCGVPADEVTPVPPRTEKPVP